MLVGITKHVPDNSIRQTMSSVAWRAAAAAAAAAAWMVVEMVVVIYLSV